MREEVELLEDHTHFLADLFHITDVVAELNAVHNDLSFLMFFEAIETANECGFPGTGRTEDDHHFSLLNGEADASKNMELIKPFMHVTADDNVF